MQAVAPVPLSNRSDAGASDWVLRPSDLKRYPHFDPVISREEAIRRASDPTYVSRHTFYPFIRYVQRWTRFAKKGEKGKPKERPIRYAARLDAYIFARYRHILSNLYEEHLQKLNMSRCVLAYRRIPSDDGAGGKCNIDFARDAFREIEGLGDCCVLAMDISNFFESLDHVELKKKWAQLLKVERLPNDHYKVFRAVTRYSVVDKQKIYEILGHFGPKGASKSGKLINGYLTRHRDMPRQLCAGQQFRALLADPASKKRLLEPNYKNYGIPQGSPISDLLANLYMLDFDIAVHSWISARGGAYFRYSDDILLILPGGEMEAVGVEEQVSHFIRRYGKRLIIKPEKTSTVIFRRSNGKQEFGCLTKPRGANGLEYLGFRFDGKYAYLRDSTLSSLYRKVTRAARREAQAVVRRYPDKQIAQLLELVNYERLVKRFGRVEDFDELANDYRNWTFWTYASRASRLFGPIGRPILRQLRRHRVIVRDRLSHELTRAVEGRDKRQREALAA